MAITSEAKDTRTSTLHDEKYPELTRRFEIWYTIFMLWLLGGAFADGWSHMHTPELEAVFTPAHIFLYTGAGLLASFVLFNAVRNFATGYDLGRVMPFGYHNAFWGVILFGISGPLDLLWHSIFGVEQNIDATFSPTHFAAMVGIFLIFSAPLVSWIKTTVPFQRNSITKSLPAIVSSSALISILSLVTSWANPFAFTFPITRSSSMSSNINQGFGMISIMFYTIFLMSLVLFTVKGQILPIGSYSLILGFNGLLTQIMAYNFILLPVSIAAGVSFDILNWWLRPSSKRPFHFRLFAFIAPVILWGLYFAVLSVFGELWWRAHTWSGAIVIPGFFGLLLSYLMVPITYQERENLSS